MITNLILLSIALIYSKGCLNDEGTYQIAVKIYLDRDSRHAITNYTHAALPHEFTDNLEDSHNEFEMAHIKHYFGMIFNEVNRTLNGTNVQFRADFTNIFKHEYSELHERYCGYFRNIIDITENFLADFRDAHCEGENKVLIVDCGKNNAFLPTSSHFATKNQCGKVHGVLLTDPEIMKHTIAEGLYRTFTKKSISQVQGVTQVIKADICTYIQFCNRNYDHTGTFVKDLGLLTHKTLEDGGVSGLGYKIGKRYVKNFGHDDAHNLEYDDGQFVHHDHLHHADNAYHQIEDHAGNQHVSAKDATYNHDLELGDHANAH